MNKPRIIRQHAGFSLVCVRIIFVCCCFVEIHFAAVGLNELTKCVYALAAPKCVRITSASELGKRIIVRIDNFELFGPSHTHGLCERGLSLYVFVCVCVSSFCAQKYLFVFSTGASKCGTICCLLPLISNATNVPGAWWMRASVVFWAFDLML